MFRYRIALYMRLSKEDEFSHVESNSITMQRMLLQSYVQKHFPDADVTEFADDGYSGTNFERPGVQELLEQVKDLRINCIIVKDACVIIEPTRKGPFERLSWPGSICF